jgi:two-component system, OmpR family, sensor kinase
MSLRFKLALIAAFLTLMGLSLGLGITYWSLIRLRILELDRESQLLAEVIYDAALFRSENQVRVPSVVESYLTDERGARAAQLYLDGQLLWERGVVHAPRPLDPTGLLGETGGRSVTDWRVYSFVAADEGIVVQVGQPLQSTWEILEPYARVAVPLTIILTLIAGAVAWQSVGLALRPLRTLSEVAEHIERAEDVPAVRGQDEPAKLARSFANLLTRLTTQRQREQQFLAYAAHELRTPLSALRAGLDAAKSNKVPASPEVLTRLSKEALRLETLAQNLLALSRAEVGEMRAETLDLSELAAAAYDRFQPLALEQGLELQLQGTPVLIRGDSRLVEQALSNLLSNALRYTKQGLITIRTAQTDEAAFLEVADTGPGLPKEMTDGLGLRVVRTVMQTHGGNLELKSDEGTLAIMMFAKARNGNDTPQTLEPTKEALQPLHENLNTLAHKK